MPPNTDIGNLINIWILFQVSHSVFSMLILHVCSQSPTFLLSAQSKQEFTVEGEWEGAGGCTDTLFCSTECLNGKKVNIM